KLPEWHRRPVIFFGRMDKLKDPITLLDAFEASTRLKSECQLILCGPQSTEIDIQKELVHRQLVGETVVLPPIPFHRTMDFLSAVSAEQGIFVSPSRGESFGLSAAESIACKVPPVLSSLDAHKDLLDKVAP